MDLDELRSVRRTEREKSQLQHLRDSFYRDVAAYVEQRKDEYRRQLANADDPFAASEAAEHIKDEVETAQEVVEALYERRVGKVVKMAAFAAAGMGADEDGLTAEERALFDDLVARIEQNRETVLSTVDGSATAEGEPAAGDPTAAESAGSRSVDASRTDETAVDAHTPDVVADAADATASDGPERPSGDESVPPVPGEATSDRDADHAAEQPGDVLSDAMGGQADSSGNAGSGGQSHPPSPGADGPAAADPEYNPEGVSGSGGPNDGSESPGRVADADPSDAPPGDSALAADVTEVTAADLDPSAPGVSATGGESASDGPSAEAPTTKPTPASETVERAPADSPDGPATTNGTTAESARQSDSTSAPDPDPTATGDGEGADLERVTVRITGDVDPIFGVDGREYELAQEDVVTLPTDNAAPLVNGGAAERLE
jgi:DNA replication factor GINS